MEQLSATSKGGLFNPTPEHEMLRQMLQEFVKNELEPQAEQHDAKEVFNLDLFLKLGDLGLLGLTVPDQYGGAGMDAAASVLVHEELSYSDPGFCLAYLVQSVLVNNNLYFSAGEDLRRRFLPDLCSGKKLGCMAMSEPGVGTDVLGMQTTAKRLDSGDYSINGRKMWITNGVLDDKGTPADVVFLYARGDGGRISTFVIERGFKGYAVGQKIRGKLGMRASNTAELVFDNCLVPRTHLVGEEGASLKHMMQNLEIERLALAGMCLGIGRRCLDVMNRYASEREAFGKKIRSFGQVQKHIAQSFAQWSAARAYVYWVASAWQQGGEGGGSNMGRLHSDGVKLVAAPMAKNLADRAIQVLGGYGYVSEYVVERLWRDAKLLEIGGGTLESHEKNIAKDLG